MLKNQMLEDIPYIKPIFYHFHYFNLTASNACIFVPYNINSKFSNTYNIKNR